MEVVSSQRPHPLLSSGFKHEHGEGKFKHKLWKGKMTENVIYI